MWITCLQENLARGLSVVGRAVPARATLPVTMNVLLETDQSRLKLTATNLEVAISTWIGAQVEHEGAITIPARLLTEFVNSLPNDKIEIELTDAPKGIAISCARFHATMNGTDSEEFPPIPTVADSTAPAAKVKTDVLKGAIERVVFAAARDDSRPVLTGVKVEMSGDSITLAAADGFRLGVDRGTLSEPIDGELSFIVPARTLQELMRLTGDGDDEIEITVSPERSQVLFRLPNTEIVSQLVQGTFPDYGKLIPQSTTTEITVPTQDFLQAAKAASIFARDGSGIIRLFVTPAEDGTEGTVRVVSKADELGDNEGVVDGNVTGVEAKVAFDSRFLLDVLNVLPNDEVTLGTSSPSSPGVLRAKTLSGYTHVVMPMFVQW